MNVLFICADNSRLSIMAESILKAVAPTRFSAFSAGCKAAKALDGEVLEFLAAHRMPVAGLRPKSLDEFRLANSPRLDFVITLCERAADDCGADWPGTPFITHWAVQDDGAGEETLRDVFWTLMRRINILASLPQGKLSRHQLQRRALTLQASYL